MTAAAWQPLLLSWKGRTNHPGSPPPGSSPGCPKPLKESWTLTVRMPLSSHACTHGLVSGYRIHCVLLLSNIVKDLLILLSLSCRLSPRVSPWATPCFIGIITLLSGTCSTTSCSVRPRRERRKQALLAVTSVSVAASSGGFPGSLLAATRPVGWLGGWRAVTTASSCGLPFSFDLPFDSGAFACFHHLLDKVLLGKSPMAAFCVGSSQKREIPGWLLWGVNGEGARLVCARQSPEGSGCGLSLPFSQRNDALLGLSSTPKPLCQLRGSLHVNYLLNHPARKLGNLGG